MKLELDRTEVERVLLEYANKLFPDAFNTVKVDVHAYGSRGEAVFSREEPEPPAPIKEIA